MNKQLVNLIGGAASVAILLLGVFAFALPQFSAAGATAASADDIAAQNRTQQTVLDTLTAQAADMASLERAVAELRAEIPEGPHIDDVMLLAVSAAVANGGQVTTVTPATAEAFAARTAEAEATDGAAAPDAAATDAATDTTSEAGTESDAAAEPAPAATPAADAAQQVAVTVVIDAPDVAAATRILDALRAGPRLVAVTQAAVTTDPEKGATLTATLLAFFRP